MMLYRVSDLNGSNIEGGEYDLAMFASGYEERCTYVPRRLERLKLGKSLVLGFEEVGHDPQRLENDEYFVQSWKARPTILRTDDDGLIYEFLRKSFGETSLRVKIVVDYSSMSRLWYAAVLNWARFVPAVGEITVDMMYAVGDHKLVASPLVIKDILSLPGCEGLHLPLSRSVAVFGLGFEGPAALCVLDRLEPDELFCYLAAPAAFADYPERARSQNKEVIKLAKACLELPLASVESSFASLAELISPYRFSEANVTLVPMGPKPHILAATLVAMRFEEVSCLRVAYNRHTPEQVGTTGEIVGTRVEFKGNRR